MSRRVRRKKRGKCIFSLQPRLSTRINILSRVSPIRFLQFDLMTTFKRRINTSLLPDDFLSYTDTKFYNVAKHFMFFAILDIKCAALNPLKEKLCLKSDDDVYIVKPDEDIKLSRKQNRRYISVVSANTTNSSIIIEPTSSRQQQLLPSNTTNIVQSSAPTMLINENYHRSFITNSISNWCQKYSSKLSLTESVDYHLFLTKSSDTNFTATIRCKCGSKIALVKFQKNFQLSNFYKHLVSLSCTTVKKSKRITTSNKSAPNENDSRGSIGATSHEEGGLKRSAPCDAAKKKRAYQNFSK
ncbi:unnamed protein product [Rotaria magnacalcarata]|uniref:Uncharacterized protein n=1 Tax=Rotaria magnacalcarata TaxID=392030 RepID=A0A820BTM9_9BILA|nr:unnamed protein product [Rotaria magnacalcarata]CAF4095979.1 unnamed protein product [Rotaria magnacalcarata]CAF4130842.1 unnamed protein product [Rotaria magnacalcarata]CAF4196798.1 unnamed protein product [Rotaria magnacalcarata]